ncbi:MAG: Outer rane efflux protein BepC precursor [Pseudomonadota bacterium]|jgi:adhesin transport system outer membrane protein
MMRARPNTRARHQRRFWIGCLLALALPSAAHGQTLDEVIRQAVRDYPSVGAADAQARSATAEIERARGAYWPTIGIDATAATVGNAEDRRRGVLPNYLAPNLRMPIYTFGRIEAEVGRTEALAGAAEFRARTAREEVAQAAAEAFLAWLRGHELAELARENLAALTAIQSDVRGIVGLDPGRGSDLLQAETRVDAARLTLSQREAEAAQARARLQRFWPHPLPARAGATNRREMDALQSRIPANLEPALAEAEQESPTIRALTAQLRAAEAQVEAARAQLWPQLDLNASTRYGGNVGVSLSAPLFNRSISEGAIRAAIEAQTAARLNLEDAREILRERARSAWVELTAAGDRQRLGEAQARTSERVVAAYRDQYRLGRRSLLDLLNVQAEAFNARSGVVQAAYDRRIARFRLMSALGRLGGIYGTAP